MCSCYSKIHHFNANTLMWLPMCIISFYIMYYILLLCTDEHPVLAVHYNTVDSIFTTVSPKSVCMWHAHTGALLSILPYSSSSSSSSSTADVQHDGSTNSGSSSGTDSVTAHSSHRNGGEITAVSADRCGRQASSTM
jgi:hypothetical protein